MDLDEKLARIEAGEERARKGCVSVLWLLLLVIGGLSMGRRSYDWDLVAYGGCALELEGKAVEELHAEAFAALEEGAPAVVVEQLTTGSPYREAVASDAEAFAAQLPFYRGRVLYVGSLALLARLGLELVGAAYLVSTLSGLALLVLCGVWIARRSSDRFSTKTGNALLLAAVLAFLLPGAHATPDALAAALLLWGAFCLLELDRPRLGLLLFALSLAARVDSAVLCVPLAAWALGRPGGMRVSLRTASAFGALAFLIVLGCTFALGSHGPWVVFHHTFVEYAAFPEASTPDFDAAAWLWEVLRRLPEFSSSAPLVFLLAALWALVSGWRRSRASDLGFGLAAVVLAATAVHFVLFPALWPRLMLPYWALSALALGWSEPSQPRSAQASP